MPIITIIFSFSNFGLGAAYAEAEIGPLFVQRRQFRGLVGKIEEISAAERIGIRLPGWPLEKTDARKSNRAWLCRFCQYQCSKSNSRKGEERGGREHRIWLSHCTRIRGVVH